MAHGRELQPAVTQDDLVTRARSSGTARVRERQNGRDGARGFEVIRYGCATIEEGASCSARSSKLDANAYLGLDGGQVISCGRFGSVAGSFRRAV